MKKEKLVDKDFVIKQQGIVITELENEVKELHSKINKLKNK